jgi:small subunit ribosomal protein S5
MDLIDQRDSGLEIPDPEDKNFKEYTSEELQALEKKYTPGQIKAILAGEAAIDVEDLESRGVIRTDIGGLPYFDDLSRLRPVVDRDQLYEGPIDPNARHLTDRELSDAWWSEYERAVAEVEMPPPKTEEERISQEGRRLSSDRIAMMKANDRIPHAMGPNGPIPRAHTPSLLAPGLPRTFLNNEQPKAQAKKETDEDDADPRDPEGLYNRLIKQTGLTLDQILDYKVKILVQHRVVNQTRLGKIASVYCLAVAGNGNGRLGIGEAKGQETEETTSNAKIAAIRSMQPIPRYEERTIFGEVEGKVSAAEVKLMCRPPGMFEPILLLKF